MSAVAPSAQALAAAAVEMGCELPPGAAQAALGYLALLQRWNRVYNLTALRDPAAMWTHHLLDSLAVVAPLRRRLAGSVGQGAVQGVGAAAPAAVRLLDVGSGGGLPGVILALACPQWQVVTVDAVGKKAGFVRQVAIELGLTNLRAEHARVEELAPVAADLVISRAFASLADFTRLTRSHLAPGGVWAAMKGRVPDDEVAALPPEVAMFHVEPLNVPGLDAERHLLWLEPGESAVRSQPGEPAAPRAP